MTIEDNLKKIREKINKAGQQSGLLQKTEIIAVTKTHPFSAIQTCYNSGVFSIGENKIQEAQVKFQSKPTLPKLKKRFIGHLQSNKVKKCLELFDTIDSIDTVKIAGKINKTAQVLNKIIPVLLEVNIAKEPQKFGFFSDEIDKMLECFECSHLHIQGLMAVAPAHKTKKQKHIAFRILRETKETLNKQKPTGYQNLTELSMGMSNDFELAVKEGSTQVRIGTALFGKRKAN
jgi:hypothetical protein